MQVQVALACLHLRLSRVLTSQKSIPIQATKEQVVLYVCWPVRQIAQPLVWVLRQQFPDQVLFPDE